VSAKMNFAMIGAAGYIAPRHMKAIKEIDGNLVTSYDLFDSVGILDTYFPNTTFYTEFEKFYIDLMNKRNTSDQIKYVTICSPNYLHHIHSELAMNAGCDVICEKPICLTYEQIRTLKYKEAELGHRVFCILQLRLHEEVLKLRQQVLQDKCDTFYNVDLEYITSRGSWYLASWKNDIRKSGGIMQNIGIHFFDMLIFVFGAVIDKKIFYRSDKTAQGFLHLEKAKVRWTLSVDEKFLPVSSDARTFRNISINGRNFEMSKGFADLHMKSYQEILVGRGFNLDDALPSVKLTEELKMLELVEPASSETLKRIS
tara:strand:+ start:10713 stop:11651 length:939 start_codon:yes stop_codon:yes gene_type:complete